MWRRSASPDPHGSPNPKPLIPQGELLLMPLPSDRPLVTRDLIDFMLPTGTGCRLYSTDEVRNLTGLSMQAWSNLVRDSNLANPARLHPTLAIMLRWLELRPHAEMHHLGVACTIGTDVVSRRGVIVFSPPPAAAVEKGHDDEDEPTPRSRPPLERRFQVRQMTAGTAQVGPKWTRRRVSAPRAAPGRPAWSTSADTTPFATERQSQGSRPRITSASQTG